VKCNPGLHGFQGSFDIFFVMLTEEQKYDSSILKNLGFAFLAPLGSIAFQVIVFKKDFFDFNLFLGIIVSTVGAILIYLGRFVIKERK